MAQMRALVWNVSSANVTSTPPSTETAFWRASSVAYLCGDEVVQVLVWNGNEIKGILAGQPSVMADGAAYCIRLSKYPPKVHGPLLAQRSLVECRLVAGAISNLRADGRHCYRHNKSERYSVHQYRLALCPACTLPPRTQDDP